MSELMKGDLLSRENLLSFSLSFIHSISVEVLLRDGFSQSSDDPALGTRLQLDRKFLQQDSPLISVFSVVVICVRGSRQVAWICKILLQKQGRERGEQYFLESQLSIGWKFSTMSLGCTLQVAQRSKSNLLCSYQTLLFLKSTPQDEFQYCTKGPRVEEVRA